MAKIKARECVVCGKEYEYCNRCSSHANMPAWMALYHDDNCRSIMNICTEYMAGNLSKADAKAQLDGCDLTNKKNFKESVLKAVNEIYATKKAAKADVAKADEELVENAEEA